MKVAFPCSKRFLDLLLIGDVDHDSTKVARFSVIIVHDTAASANPLARSRFAIYPIMQVETATGLDRPRYGLLSAFSFFLVKKGKEQFVSKG